MEPLFDWQRRSYYIIGVLNFLLTEVGSKKVVRNVHPIRSQRQLGKTTYKSVFFDFRGANFDLKKEGSDG
jgi:hypothetical protein